MNMQCACGGRFHRHDPVRPARCVDGSIMRNQGCVVYETVSLKPGYATFKCAGCGMIRTQRLRMSKENAN